MREDLISVVIPCYNVEKYLNDCFDSLTHQTYKNIEIIFVNDGSKDGTLPLLMKFCDGKDNCLVIDQQNQGVSAARNAGLSHATGKYVYFFDPDDLLSPNILTILHDNMVKNDADMSICSFNRVKEDYKMNWEIKDKNCKKVKIFNQIDAMCQLLSGRLFDLCPWNKLFKLELLTQVPNFPNVYDGEIRYGEDTDLNFKYMQQCSKICFTPQKLYFYRLRKGSLVRSSFNEKRLTTFIGINRAIEASRQNFPQVEKYAKSWKGLVSVEMLYYIYKSDYENADVILELLNNLKENMGCIVKCKRNHLYRRIFVPLTYPLFKIFLNKRLRQSKKKTC